MHAPRKSLAGCVCSSSAIVEPTRHIPALKYLAGYPPELLAQVSQLIAHGRLGETLRRRYPEAHDVRTDHALYDYVGALKSRFLRNAQAIAKVAYDNKLHVIQHALGTHTSVSRVSSNFARMESTMFSFPSSR